METNVSIITELRDRYQGKDWFYDAGFDPYGRPVVYVNYECHETCYDLPDKIQGKQLLVHFSASIKVQATDFLVPPTISPAHIFNSALADPVEDSAEQDKELELSVAYLTNQLDNLEKICGSNILQDLFYESHDGKNAVTNLSSKFPEVRKKMQELYDQYGFDIIYGELNG